MLLWMGEYRVSRRRLPMTSPGMMQDKTLLALMTIGAIILVLLLRASLLELLVTWIIILFGILIVYSALRAVETSSGHQP